MEQEITNKQIYEWITMLDTKIQTINKRTKAHTTYIKQLEKKVKELENKKESEGKKAIKRLRKRNT